jgi:dolichol-phosphate mannosyltransferase
VSVPTSPPRARVAIVIPAYNEEGKIDRVVAKIPCSVVDAVIVVDDASSDATAADAHRGGAIVITHLQNRGVGAAIRTGIDYARSNGFDIVAVLSGDDQHDPSELPRVLAPLQADACDLVQGSRRLGGGATVDMTLFRRLTTRVYPWLFRVATRLRFHSTDATNGFRAFRLSIFDDPRIDLWQPWLDTYELEPYLLFKAVVTGKRVREVPITIVYHARGTTKMKPFRDWWRIARPLVFLSLGLRK